MTVDKAPQTSEDRFRWRDPAADRTTLHRLRGSLRDWVVGLGTGDRFGDDVVLAAYEAAANAVEHGNLDAPGTVVVDAEYGRDGLELRVTTRAGGAAGRRASPGGATVWCSCVR